MARSPGKLTSQEAWDWWVALMGNVVSLLEDAETLLKAGSPGRARSLTVLASEELAKALWVHEASSPVWDGMDGPVELPGDFERRSNRHPPKLRTSEKYRSLLDEPYDGIWPRASEHGDSEEFAAQADLLNDEKQAGFYVDWVDGRMRQPADADPEMADRELRAAARAASLHMTQDWMRILRAYGVQRPLDHLTSRLNRLAREGQIVEALQDSDD